MKFVKLDDLRHAKWYSEPPDWTLNDEGLAVTTGLETDFWQDTFYGFRRDDGHFLGLDVVDDFTAVAAFEANYERLYDQAGLMIRVDEMNWVKLGIEFSDDVTNFSVVVTRNGRSDWSVVTAPGLVGPQEVRISRIGGAVIAHYRRSDQNWALMRLADFPAGKSVCVGPMACSPTRAGFKVRFRSFAVVPPIEKPLHGNAEN